MTGTQYKNVAQWTLANGAAEASESAAAAKAIFEDVYKRQTMHAAKGLEFPVVFLPGFEDGIFPGIQTLYNPEEMEEDRRLCYVALTRAKEELYITRASSRMLYGCLLYTSGLASPTWLRPVPCGLKRHPAMEKWRASPSV